jgi:hypothetical protein
MQLVAFYVAREFGTPIFRPGCRDAALSAAGMLMPKAAMDEDYSFAPPECEVRFAGKGFIVKPISITKFSHGSPDHQLRIGVLVLNLSHVG